MSGRSVICCIRLVCTSRGEQRRGLEAVFQSPDANHIDHHEVYRRFFDTEDPIAALTLAIAEYTADERAKVTA